MPNKQSKILIIEDDEIVRLNTSEYLLSEGFDVLTAEDGLEGIEIVTKNKPDMIICDIAMPVMDGYQVYEKIKSNNETKYIPFVFLTAKVDTPDILKGIKLGVDDYITKPFNLEKLTAIINNKLKRNSELSIAAEIKSRAYIETSDNPVFIFRDNSFVYLNPKFVAEFNLSNKKISEISIKDLIDDYDCERLTEEINRCLNFKSKNFKISCTTKPVSGKPKQYDIFGSLGEFEGSPAVQCNLYDISGVKDIIEKINIAEKDYSDLLQILPVGICKMDVYGKILYANNSLSKLTGYSEDELKDKFLWQVIGNPNDSTLIMDMLKKLREGYSKPFSIFTENYNKDGKPYKTELQWNYIRDSGQKNIGFIFLFIDITAREIAKNAYEESEKKLNGIAEILSDWIWEIDNEGYYTYASPKVFDILGYTPEEIIGKKPSDFIIGNEIEKVSEFVNELMIKKTYFKNYLNICKHKNGSEVIIESSGIPIFDDDGYFKGYFGTDRNITDIISKEKELNETQKRLNILLEKNSEVAVYEFESGNDFISENLNSMLGYNNSKLKTKENLYSIIYPDDLYKSEGLKNQWFENKTSSPFITDLRLRDKSGNYIWFQDRCYLIRKDSGEYYVNGLLINIHKRKEKEVETKELLMTIDQLPLSAIILDVSGKIKYVNNKFETETGYSRDIAIGRHISAFFTDKNFETINSLLNKVYNTKYQSSGFISLRTEKGEELMKNISLSTVLSDDGEVINYMLIINDITELNNEYNKLKEIISKAEDLHRTKLVLLRSLSHEFSTPMNSILGFTEILMNSIMDNSRKKMIKGIEVSAKKLLKTTDSIIRLAMTEIINDIKNYEIIDLKKALTEIFESFYPAIEKKGIKPGIEINENDLFVLANYSLLEQSVSNIIDNAIKFTYSGSISIYVESFENEGERFALINIKDTGIGIPKVMLGYVFRDPDAETKNYRSYFESTGLGLTLSKKIIEMMKGSIKVDSSPDVGTTVTIIFPLTTNQYHYE